MSPKEKRRRVIVFAGSRCTSHLWCRRERSPVRPQRAAIVTLKWQFGFPGLWVSIAQVLKPQLPDGTFLHFELPEARVLKPGSFVVESRNKKEATTARSVPLFFCTGQNVQPGHLVELKNLEGAGAVVRIVELLQAFADTVSVKP